MYVFGIVIFWVGVLLSMYFKHVTFSVLMNPAAMAVLLFSLTAVIVSTSSYKTFIAGLNSIFFKRYVITEETRIKAVELFRLLSKTAVFASIIGLIIGFIASVGNVTELEPFSHAIASALISPLLCLITCVAIFEPAVFILNRRTNESLLIKAYPKHISDKLVELCNQNGITEEDILAATNIVLKKN